MRTITSLLVGMHFRPPAKQILAVLPASTELGLCPEPENPYDASALKVTVWPSAIPEPLRGDLSECLEGTGMTLEELLAMEEPFFLGYVAASGGKPLAKAGLTQGNKEFLSLMAACEGYVAKLSFAPDGAPLVRLSEGTQANG